MTVRQARLKQDMASKYKTFPHAKSKNKTKFLPIVARPSKNYDLTDTYRHLGAYRVGLKRKKKKKTNITTCSRMNSKQFVNDINLLLNHWVHCGRNLLKNGKT